MLISAEHKTKVTYMFFTTTNNSMYIRERRTRNSKHMADVFQNCFALQGSERLSNFKTTKQIYNSFDIYRVFSIKGCD